MKKRIFAILLTVCMVLSMVPASVFAADSAPEAFVPTYSLEDGTDFILAAENEGGYKVLTVEDGRLAVAALAEISTETVDKAMLWTFSGAKVKSAGGEDYLVSDENGLELSADATPGWEYNGQEFWFEDEAENDFSAVLEGTEFTIYVEECLAVTEEEVLEAAAKRVEQAGNKKAGTSDVHYIAVGSDRHSNTSAIASAMGGMPKDVEFVCLAGDMTTNNAFSTSTFVSEVKDGAGLTNATIAMIQDRHDTTNANDDAGIMFLQDYSGVMYTGYNDDGSVVFYVYVASHNSLFNSGTSDAAEFKTWVDENCQDTSIPIIVIAHVPLHYNRGDNPGGPAWNEALNYAATGKENATSAGEEVIRNVIFLHGHNHTTESNYEFYIPVGSTMKFYDNNNSSYIYYTYTTAGYLNANKAASLITIADDNITVTKYKNGSVSDIYANKSASSSKDFSDTYQTGATHTIERVVKPTSMTINDIEVQPAADGSTPAQQIEYTFKIEGEAVTPTTIEYTLKSDENSIVKSISDSGLITFNQGRVGTATVTVSWTYSSGAKAEGDISDSKDITVSVKTASVTRYVETDAFVEGKDHILAVGTGNTVTALKNNDGSLSTASLTVKNGKIDTDDTGVLWKYNGGSTYYLTNQDSYYLNVTNSGTARDLYISSSSNAAYGVGYDSDTAYLYLRNFPQSTNLYYLTFDGTTYAVGAKNSTSGAAEVRLFVETEAPADPEYEFTVKDLTTRLNEDGSIDNKSIVYTLKADGETITPDTVTFTKKTDADNIISAISNTGEITFTGNLGTATVTVGFSYTQPAAKSVINPIPDGNGTISDSVDITVTVGEYIYHEWSSTPTWVWADDYSTAVAKFGCLVPECLDEFTADATIVVTENDPTCLEAKIYTYTATAVGPNGQTYTDVKTSGGLHEVNVYKLVTSLSANKDYLIVSTNQSGTDNGVVLTNSSSTLGTSTVTIHPASEEEEIDANFIVAADVPAGAVWSTGDLFTATISNTSYTGYKLANAGCYLQITGSGSTLAAPTSETYSQSVWNYTSSNTLHYRYSGQSGEQNRYVRYNNNAFSGNTSSSYTVYIYERTTVHQGETGPHDYQFKGITWNTGYESAYGTYECSVCGTTATVPATVVTEDKEANCERPYRTQHTATIAKADSLDGKKHVDDSEWEEKQKPVVTGTKTATVYRLISGTTVTTGTNYLIVNANTEQNGAHALKSSGSNNTAVGDASVNIISGQVNGADAIYIETVDSAAVWTASNSTTAPRFQNGSYYLYRYRSSGGGSYSLRVSTSNTSWTLGDGIIYYDGSSDYYIRYDDGWGIQTTVPDTKVYLFEEVADATVANIEYVDTEPLGHQFPLTHTEAAAAGCETEGNIEYWTCEREFEDGTTCGQHFSDAEGNTKLDEEDIVIAALGHDWDPDKTIWTWNTTGDQVTATATLVCSRDESHTHGPIDAAVTGPVDGVYTATVTYEGFTDTDTYGAASAHEHTYGAPVFNWVEVKDENDVVTGYTCATATFTCTASDCDHSEGYTFDEAVELGQTTTPAACETAGQKLFTASVTLNGSDYTDSKTVTIPALGHNWDYDHVTWDWEEVRSAAGYNVTASIPCTRCSAVDVRDAEVTYDDDTCVYTASIYDGETLLAYDTKVVLPAEEYTIYIVADPDTPVVAGDTVTFTIKFGPVQHFGSYQMKLVIPEGLTYVSNSFTLDPSFESTTGFHYFYWNDNTLIAHGNATTADYSNTEGETVYATFRCTVNEGYSGTTDKVSLTKLEFVSCQYPYTDYTELYTVEGTTVTVLATHTITFNANDGSASPATTTQTVADDQSTQLTANSFTRTGYTFSGWNTKADGSGTAYTDGQNVALTADLTLYAQWTANTFTVADIEGTFTYNGEAHTPAVTVTDGDKTLVLGTDYTVEYSNNVNAGTATVTVTGIGDYCAAGSVEKTFTIGKAAITASATGYEGTYDGAVHGITVTVTAPASGYTITYSETQSGTYSATARTYKNAGEYTVYYKVTADNYEDAAGSAIIKIEKKEIGITWGTTSFTYDGESHVPTATATGVIDGDTVNITVSGAQTTAGTYTATATALDNDNYKLPAANTTSFTISATAMTVSATGYTGVYDGTAHGITVTVTVPASGYTITYSATENGTYSATAPTYTNAGEYTVYYKVTAANYTESAGSAVVKIEKKEVAIAWTNTEFTYDKTSHVPTATASGLIAGDTVNVTVSGAQTNAGTYTATATALDNDNYKLPASATTSFTIAQKEVGLTWTNTEFAYDGQQHVPTATATGVVSGDTVTVTVTGAASAVGTHTATATALSNSNYKLPANVTTQFEIVKGSQTAPTGVAATDETVSGKNDGTITGLTAGMEYSEDGQTWTTITEDMLEDGALTGVEPGTYYVRYAETDNYNASSSVPVTVNASQNKLTVSFNMNGHGTAIAAQEVDYNGKATAPAAPTATGYTFGGWYKEAACTNAYDFDAAVTADTVIYAKWTAIEYRITYHTNGGTMPATYPQTYTIEDTITLPTPEKENYGFAGWFDNEGLTGNAVAAIAAGSTGDKEFWADWSLNSFLITWKNEDGTVIETTRVAYGAVPTHEAPAKASTAQYDYVFAGWSPTPVAATADAEYIATFTPVLRSYTITWMNDDGTTIDTTTVEYGTVPTHEAPNKAADAQYTYTFAGWDPEPVAVTGEATYTATYTTTVNSYTITWKDADGTTIDTTTVPYGTVPTHAEPTKAADADYRYEFAGWTPAVAAVTGAATYTATYNEIARTYGQPVWTWTGSDADGYTAAKATFTTNDGYAEFTKEMTDSEIETEIKNATCVNKGQITYTASVTFNGTAYTDSKVVETPALGHDLTAHPATAATCTTPGNTAYWSCSRCGKYFSDAEGKNEIAANSWVIESFGHDWSQPVWNWTGTTAATATFTCGNDASHVETLNALITSAGEDGVLTYTASVTFNGLTFTDTKSFVYPVRITSVRLELLSKIGIRIYFKVPENAKTAKIFWEADNYDESKAVTMELTTEGNKYYNPKTGEFLMIYPKVTSRQMTMHIRFVIYDENGDPMDIYYETTNTFHDDEFVYCAADWANRVIATSTNEKAITMAKSLLAFGGAAQLYLNNYNPDHPTNPEGYMADEMAALVPDPALDAVIPANAEAVGLTDIKLDLAEETSIRLYFNKAVTVKVDGKAVKVYEGSGGNTWLAIINGIYSRYLNHMYEIEITGEDGTVVISYSALSWANDKIANGPDAAIPTAKALYLYHYAAVDYLGQ